MNNSIVQASFMLTLIASLTTYVVAKPSVGNKIDVGKGVGPYLALERSNANIHIAYEADGGVHYAVLSRTGTIIKTAALVPGSKVHGGGISGNAALAVDMQGNPYIFVNESVFNQDNDVRAYAIVYENGAWQAPVVTAISDAQNSSNKKGNRPWEPAAIGDRLGYVHLFLSRVLAPTWDQSPRVYRKMKGTKIVESKNVVDQARAEGNNDITVDKNNNLHFAWANSSSGLNYRKYANGSFGKTLSAGGRSGFDAGVAVGPDNSVHVVWDAKLEVDNSYGLVSGNGITKKNTIAKNASKTSIAIDSEGYIYIVYYSHSDNTIYLIYKTIAASSWSKPQSLGKADAPNNRNHLNIRSLGAMTVTAGSTSGNIWIRIIDNSSAVGLALQSKFSQHHLNKRGQSSYYCVVAMPQGRGIVVRNGKHIYSIHGRAISAKGKGYSTDKKRTFGYR